MRNGARDHLASSNPEIEDARKAARHLLTSHLVAGLDGAGAVGCDFFSETSVEGKPTEFIVSLPKMPFTFMLLENKFLDPPSIRSALTDQGSVAYLLTRLGQFYFPILRVRATGFQPVCFS